MSYLTDKEKRLLFSALSREKKVCRKLDEEIKEYKEERTELVPIINSLEKKFYYDRFEQEIRDKAIEEFAEALEEQSERFSTIPFTWVSTKNIRKIAEQMKEQKEEYKFDRESDYELE